MNPTAAKPKRPFGVYAIILLLLLRILGIFFDVVRVNLDLTPCTLPELDKQMVNTIVIGVYIAAILALCMGLFLLKRWAWIAVMILIGSNLLIGIVFYLNNGELIVSLPLDVISVFYLNLRGVQAAFEGRQTRPEAAI